MKRNIVLSILLMVLTLSVSAQSQRKTTNFDSNWQFSLGDMKNPERPTSGEKEWRTLNLPHDWSIEGENKEDAPGGGRVGYFPSGIGWYKKTFSVPAWSKNKRYSIEFDGVYMNSTVWVNGVKLGVRPYGYVSFSYDLTPYLKASGNTIYVRVDNSQQPNSRWYTGSGIYRHVRLVETAPTHFEKWSVFNYTQSVADGKAVVWVEAGVENELNKSVGAVVKHQIVDAEGVVVSEVESAQTLLAAAQNKKFETKMTVENPKLWSVDSPNLYTLRSVLTVDGKEVDSVEDVLGIRTIEYDIDKGFLLNGERIKMYGVNLHHDAGGLGAAVPERVWERRLELLKESGCNAIRTAHNPPAPEFLDLCDRMGFLVMDEAFDEWAAGKNTYSYQIYFREWHEQDLLAMVLRDRNHPSVVMWSIGNEVPDQSSAEGPEIARKLISICKANDPTRLVTAGNDRIAALNGATPEYLAAYENEIVGYNYPDRWRERRELVYAVDKAAFPNRRVVATEASGLGGARDYSLGMDPNKVTANYGGNRLVDVEQRWKFTMLYDYVIGDFMWTGIDNYGESSWPSRIHSAGYLDNCGFKKDGFYFFKSLWTDVPTLHIFPHWNWKGREGQVLPVICYTNCESVELFVNGKSYGKKSLEFPRKGVELGWNRYGEGKVFTSTADLHLSWDVVYEPGEIVAVGVKDGKEFVHRIVTTGEPASIRLSVDRDVIGAVPSDVAHVTVEVLDKDGNVVPTADNLIKFAVEGANIIGVENGNGRDLESCKIPERKAYAGLCMAIVQADKAGDIKFTATSEGLQGAEISFRAE
ncbi:MAG: DUF4982 domain-containing protein [Tidjanibacter sp.]|nr:DUF4982 domain-containing protein [Tidjanibacter sp.]